MNTQQLSIVTSKVRLYHIILTYRNTKYTILKCNVIRVFMSECELSDEITDSANWTLNLYYSTSTQLITFRCFATTIYLNSLYNLLSILWWQQLANVTVTGITGWVSLSTCATDMLYFRVQFNYKCKTTIMFAISCLRSEFTTLLNLSQTA